VSDKVKGKQKLTCDESRNDARKSTRLRTRASVRPAPAFFLAGNLPAGREECAR
jgi:hypothetical protein